MKGLRKGLLAITGILSCTTLFACGSQQTSSQAIDVHSAESASTMPLDDIPGLGISEQAALRDDTIAYFEAWERDALVSECLAKSHIEWKPEALFPREELRSIADLLGVEPVRDDSSWPEIANRKMRDSLGEADRERYAQAMYGETAEDVAYWESHEGAAPPGMDQETFATGGCNRVGWKEIPGVWQFKSRFAHDLETLRQEARTTEAFLKGQAEYESCVAEYGYEGATSPGDVERQARSQDGLDDKSGEALSACSGLWSDANKAGLAAAQDSFRQQHRDAIQEQTAEYEAVWEQLQSSAPFKEYLAAAAGRSQQAG